ncbi:hypothetical protein FM120_08700 [Sphingobacterium faecium PCAi_F2.5]|nr:hypothetical protein FM120_08700 [Sphingobacterium faecium PCAi_F2.5]
MTKLGLQSDRSIIYQFISIYIKALFAAHKQIVILVLKQGLQFVYLM